MVRLLYTQKTAGALPSDLMAQKPDTMNPHMIDPQPEDFWQDFVSPQTYEIAPTGGHHNFYPAELADGRQLALPIRQRGDSNEALASLIINQASLSVLDTLAGELADKVKSFAPDIVVAVPTLGLTLGQETARRLGHSRYVPLSTSRKFWYDERLSVPMQSVTSPDQQKRLYLDPRMLPLLKGRSILLVDDVISTGSSITAGCDLLGKCGLKPNLIGCAMLQTDRWRKVLSEYDPELPSRVVGVFSSPLLIRGRDEGWYPA